MNKFTPSRPYQTVRIQSNKLLDCWLMNAHSANGTVLLFHGYGGEKSSMQDKADEFLKMKLNVLLVDFMGAGGSEGAQTTIGFKEAEEVKDCFEYIQKNGEKNIHLFGTSMGAVAIMKAINDYNLQPKSIIIECPFGTMYQTVCARFKIVNVPTFPMAGMLMFWGGVQNGFWAFSHNPVDYAKNISVPTLLLYGEKDNRVSREEINTIFSQLKGQKSLVTFPLAGHENYLNKYKEEWTNEVGRFLLATER
ncbi:MAG TPA: alpha/beta hydrolase [Flavisolibacter sp.]|nr:alpha/beta hydrolase [Flavisolibacter sp.]